MRASHERRERGSRSELEHLVTQLSLFETKPSLDGLREFELLPRKPRAIFVGIGLCSRARLSHAVPLDTVGMLLAAEHVRRAADARELQLLLADSHALSNGLPARAVARCADRYEQALRSLLAALGVRHSRVVRACELHSRADYRALHDQVRARAPAGEHPYVTREVADIEYFDRACGGVLKLGWALRASRAADDERAFDRRFVEWMGTHVSFVYCKAGRALDDRHRKVAPYVALDPGSRICIDRDEDVAGKLDRAARRVSFGTMRGVRNHLKAITRSYRTLVRPLSGPLETQLQGMLDDLLRRDAEGQRTGSIAKTCHREWFGGSA